MPGTWPTSAISRSSRPSICPSIDPSSMPSFTSSRLLPPTRSTRSSPSATFSPAIVSKPQPEKPLIGVEIRRLPARRRYRSFSGSIFRRSDTAHNSFLRFILQNTNNSSTSPYRSWCAFHHFFQMVQIMNQPAVQDTHDPLFQKALQFVLHWEGGFVDDPDDLGGRTNKGITQRVYDVYRAKKGVPPQDVKNISDDETSDIYFEEYWLAAKCNHINPELGMALFDTAVNLGDKHALLFMQEATGCHSADGVYGPQTQAAWDSCSVMASATQFCMLREKHYRALAN